MKFLAGLLVLALMVVAGLSPAPSMDSTAQAAETSVYGFVRDGYTDYGIPNLTVTITYGTTTFQTTTDASGKYLSGPITPGSDVTAEVCNVTSSSYSVWRTGVKMPDITIYNTCDDGGYVPGVPNPPDRNWPPAY